MIEKQLTNIMIDLISNIRAIQMWFHGAHLVSKGVGFRGEHETYSEIYQSAESEFDSYVEKVIGLTNDEKVASPKNLSKLVCEKLKFWPEVVDSDPLSIAVASFNIAKNHVEKITNTYNRLKSSGDITLGLDDLLMNNANNWEGIVYKLQQRIKSELN